MVCNQVGVNNTAPKSTLDVTVKNSSRTASFRSVTTVGDGSGFSYNNDIFKISTREVVRFNSGDIIGLRE